MTRAMSQFGEVIHCHKPPTQGFLVKTLSTSASQPKMLQTERMLPSRLVRFLWMASKSGWGQQMLEVRAQPEMHLLCRTVQCGDGAQARHGTMAATVNAVRSCLDAG